MADVPSPAAASPSWHFPGPSSRYHLRERSNSQGKVSRPAYYYASTAPTLATEIRAHRRTRSSYATSQTSSQNTPHGPAASSPRPVSNHARSPLGRYLPDDHDTIKSHSRHAHHAHRRHPSQPVTPAKNSTSRRRVARDSPFSDYFTDEARSVDQAVIPTAAQQVLAHLAKLQSKLIRHATNGSGADGGKIEGFAALALVEQKLSEIDTAMSGLSCVSRRNRTRQQLSDSGVELEAEDEGDEDTNSHDGGHYHNINTSFDGSVTSSSSNPSSPFNDSPYLAATLDSLTTSPDTTPLPPPQFSAATATTMNHPLRLHTQMATIVRSVSVAQTELRQRCADARFRNEHHRDQLEGQESALDVLRSENESLRADLELENCELLFLKLQMKAIQLHVGSDPSRHGGTTEATKQKQESSQVLQDIERWQEDWQDVAERFERRKSRYDEDTVPSKGSSPHGPLSPNQFVGLETIKAGQETDPRVQWRLAMTKDEHHSGWVKSVTIERVPDVEEIPDNEAGPEREDRDLQESSLKLDEVHDEPLVLVGGAAEPLAELAEPQLDAPGLTAAETNRDHDDDEVTDEIESVQVENFETGFVESATEPKSSAYVDQSTQTDPLLDLPLLAFPDELYPALPEDDDLSNPDERSSLEEAITMAPSSPLAKRKSAWDELWDGLSTFAGMEDD
jgi:hypothetical protein